jgi:glycerate 2-kinase
VKPIVVAPGPFKGALSASDAARAIAAGFRLAATGVETRLMPVADGGQGTVDALVAAAGGRTRSFTVADPLGRPVDAALGLLPGGTVAVELAAASGYERLADGERDPEATSTYGTGELIRAALDLGATRIIVAVGGSATNDGGLGLARALGVRALDGEGRELDGRGGDLSRVASLDLSDRDPRIADVEIVVACDVETRLVGPEGAAHVFGPQKGADAAAVARLDAGLAHLAAMMKNQLGLDLAATPRAGAAGGAAAGLVALLGARLESGAELVLDAIGFAEALEGAGLCITGEGRLDESSLVGKAPAAVAAACQAAGLPCVAVCGEVALLPGLIRRAGFAAAFPIGRELRSREAAMTETETDLAAMGAALAGLATGHQSP